MALDKVIDSAQLDANLTAVADAIRTKGGTTGELEFPDGFVSAVEGIQAGGGLSEQEIIDAMAKGTWPSGDIVINDANFEGIIKPPATSLYLPEASYIGVYTNWSELKKLVAPKALRIGGAAFMSQHTIEEVYAPELIYSGNNCFRNCSSLRIVIAPKFPSVKGNMSSFFTACPKLEKVDIFAIEFGSNAFNDGNSLKHLILRNTSIVPLPNTTGYFVNTPLAGYNGLSGYVYVPRALLSNDVSADYRRATNWSTYYEAGSCIFRVLEDYTIDGTTTGEMDWAKIEAEEVTA